MRMLLCVDVMMMFSVYVVSFTDAYNVGVTDVYKLNSVGDGTRLVEHQLCIGIG